MRFMHGYVTEEQSVRVANKQKRQSALHEPALDRRPSFTLLKKFFIF